MNCGGLYNPPPPNKASVHVAKVDAFNILLFIHLNFYTKAAKNPKENSDDDDDGTHRKRSMESNQERQDRPYTGRWPF